MFSYRIVLDVRQEPDQKTLSNYIDQIEFNAIANKILFFENEEFQDSVKTFKQQAYNYVLNDFPATYYIRKDKALAKLVITSNIITMEILEPYCKHRTLDINSEPLDMAIYITIALELCEQIPLWELRTEAF